MSSKNHFYALNNKFVQKILDKNDISKNTFFDVKIT